MKKKLPDQKEEVNQDRPPNFRDEKGRLYLVRCFNCGGPDSRLSMMGAGRENWAVSVASGKCAVCGWCERN